MIRARQLLDEIGLRGERIEMFNLSAAMGARLAEIAAEMTEKVKALGPNPLGRRSQQGTRSREQGAGSREQGVGSKE